MQDIVSGGIELLKEAGFYTLFLPLILVFTLTYAVLCIIKPFGDPTNDPVAKRLYIIISVGFAFFVVWNRQIVNWILTSLPTYGLVLLAAFSFLLLLGIIGKPEWMENKWFSFAVALFCLGLGIYIFVLPVMGGQTQISGGVSFEIVEPYIPLIVILLVLGIIIWLVTRTGGESTGH